MQNVQSASDYRPANVDDNGKRAKDNDLKVYTWNVRTLYRPGSAQQLTDALVECKADITVF